VRIGVNLCEDKWGGDQTIAGMDWDRTNAAEQVGMRTNFYPRIALQQFENRHAAQDMMWRTATQQTQHCTVFIVQSNKHRHCMSTYPLLGSMTVAPVNSSPTSTLYTGIT